MSEKPVMSLISESNGLMKKRPSSAQGLVLQGVSLVCAAYAVLLCSGCSILPASHLQRLSFPDVGSVWPLA